MDARAKVMGLITAAWPTQAIGVAAQLALFDRLDAGPRRAAELAAETGSHPGALFRLMRALATLGLLAHLGVQRRGVAGLGERREARARGRADAEQLEPGLADDDQKRREHVAGRDVGDGDAEAHGAPRGPVLGARGGGRGRDEGEESEAQVT